MVYIGLTERCCTGVMGYSRTVEKSEEDGSFRCALEMKLCCSQHFNCMQCWRPASVLMCARGNRSILWETGLFSERGSEERSLTLFSWQSSRWDISCLTDLLLSAALMFSVCRVVVSLKDQHDRHRILVQDTSTHAFG